MMTHLSYWKSKLWRQRLATQLLRTNEAIARGEIVFHQAVTAQTIKRRQPQSFGNQQVSFEAHPETKFVAAGVYELTVALVDLRSGWVYTAKGELLLESTWYTGYPDDVADQKINVARFPQPLDGNILSLVSDFSVVNYGHKLYDSFGRYYLFENSDLNINEIDFVILPGKKSERWLRVAKRLGIPGKKVLWANEFDFVKVKRLFVTSYPGKRRNYPSWLVNYLKDMLSDPVKSPQRRMYVQRTGRRKVANEQDLLPILKDAGFEIYLPENSSNSFADFAEAQAIIGAHGAGLNDLAFCNPGTKVLELIPSDHIYEYFYTIADSAGLNYACLVGESASMRPKGAKGPSLVDFYVDPGQFSAAVKEFFG